MFQIKGLNFYFNLYLDHLPITMFLLQVFVKRDHFSLIYRNDELWTTLFSKSIYPKIDWVNYFSFFKRIG